MRVPRAFAVLVPVLVAACAQVLSYDDYRARPDGSEVGGDAPADTHVPLTDTGPTVARAPERPPGDAVPSNKGRTLWVAAKRLYLGTTNSLGAPSNDGWKEWGFDLDSVCTSLEDSVKNLGTCRRHPEANQDVLLDGNLCRDNNFGRHVVALLKVSSDGFEQRINDGILEGNNTWVIRIDDLDDAADDPYAPARFYRTSEQKDGTVKWDGTDVRRVSADSVVDRSLDKALVVFASGYVRNHVWVSGDASNKEIVLPFSTDLNIPLQGTLITLQLDPDHKNGKRAALGGAIPMSQLEKVLAPVAAAGGFCPGSPLYTSLLRNVSRFPDVVMGAPNLQDETKDCDGMSLGIGFDVQAIQPITQVVDAPPPEPSKCGDAGP